MDDHVRHVRWVLEKLRENTLFAKHEKCSFGLHSIEYLGHVVSAAGVQPDPDKVRAIKEWPRPTSVYDVRVFLGIANYY